MRGTFHQATEDNNVNDDDDDNDDENVGSLICNNNVCVIVTDDKSSDTVWFVLVTDNDCYGHVKECKDAYGHVVSISQPFLKCHFLERHGDNNKGVIYKKSKKEASIYKESIVHPVVEMALTRMGYTS